MSVQDAIFATMPGLFLGGSMAFAWWIEKRRRENAEARLEHFKREATLALNALDASEATKRDLVARYQQTLNGVLQNQSRCRDEFESIVHAVGPQNPALVDHLRDLMDRVSGTSPPPIAGGRRVAAPDDDTAPG